MTEKRKREKEDDWRWTEIAHNRGEAHLGVMHGICVHAVEMHLNTFLFYAAVLCHGGSVGPSDTRKTSINQSSAGGRGAAAAH